MRKHKMETTFMFHVQMVCIISWGKHYYGFIGLDPFVCDLKFRLFMGRVYTAHIILHFTLKSCKNFHIHAIQVRLPASTLYRSSVCPHTKITRVNFQLQVSWKACLHNSRQWTNRWNKLLRNSKTVPHPNIVFLCIIFMASEDFIGFTHDLHIIGYKQGIPPYPVALQPFCRPYLGRWWGSPHPQWWPVGHTAGDTGEGETTVWILTGTGWIAP